MKRHRLMAALGMLLTAVGCGSEQSYLAAGQAVATGPKSPEVARSQKRDREPAVSPPPITPVRATNVDTAEPPKGELAVRIWAHVNGVAILDSEVRDAAYGALVESLQR